MDPPDPFATGGRPSPTNRSQLQGPRPTPLKVSKDSHKIKKPPVAPQSHHHHHQLPPQAPLYPAAAPATTTSQTQNSEPVIIYAVSPKVIHTTVSDFMNLVQRLTSSTTDTSSAAAARPGDVSPAARLASIEKVSPPERERVPDSDADDFLRILEENGVEIRHNFPGILSPAPETLPPMSPSGLFTPTMDHFMQISNMFIPSPSTMFSTPMASPAISSSFDLYSQFFDF